MKLFSKRIILAIGLILFTFLNSSAQNFNNNPYWEGKIKLTDGTVKTGYVMVPSSSKENYIAFKPTMDGKKETVKRKEIESIVVTSKTGREYLYENIPAVLTITGKTSWGTSLLLVFGKNSYATFYIESQKYIASDKTGEISLLYRYDHGTDFPTVSYYIRKKGAPKANLFYITRHLGGIKKGVNHHLTEDPELIKRVNGRELKQDDIPEIISTYLKTTEGM